MKRRTLLKATLVNAAAAATVFPNSVQAAYPSKAFRAEQAVDALREVFGTADIAASNDIEIEVPDIARDGKMVPVKVRSGIENTESISLVVEANENPFTAYFRLFEPQAYVSTRIRMAKSSEMLVVVKAGGVLHTRTRMVRVGGNMCRA